MDSYLKVIFEQANVGRRIGAGAIFIFIIASPTIFKISNDNTNVISLTIVLENPIILLSILFISYFIGVLIDATSDTIIIKFISAAGAAFSHPVNKFRQMPTTSYVIIMYFYLIIMPLLFYYYIIRSLFGKSDYKIDLPLLLSGQARVDFESLPAGARRGFRHPLGIYAPEAWQTVLRSFGESNRDWLIQTQRYRRDVLVYVSSIIIASLFAASLLAIDSEKFDFVNEIPFLGQFLSSGENSLAYVIPLLIVVVSYMYLYFLKRDIVTALHLYSSESREKDSQGPSPSSSEDKFGVRKSSARGRAFEMIFLFALIIGNLGNYLRWNLENRSESEYNSIKQSLLVLTRENSYYDLLTSSYLQTLYKAIDLGSYYALVITVLVVIFRTKIHVSFATIRNIFIAVFGGVVLGVFARDLAAWLSELTLEHRGGLLVSNIYRSISVAFMYAILHLLSGDKMRNTVRGSFSFLIMYSSIVFSVETALEYLARTLPQIASISLEAVLVDAAPFIAFAIALIFANYRRRSHHGLFYASTFKRQLRAIANYAGTLLVLGLIFNSVRIGPWIGLNYWVERGLRIDIGYYIVVAAGFVGLLRFARPLREFFREYDRRVLERGPQATE